MVMSSFVIIVEVIFVVAFVSYLNYFYGNWKKQNKPVTVVSLIAWFLPILILFVIPIDISVVYFHKCEDYNNTAFNTTPSKNPCNSPWMYIDKDVLLIFWHFAYWTTFSLTWILLPIFQSYAKSGSFTFMGKLKSALIDNAIYYGTYLFVVVIIGIYLLIKRTIPLNISSIKVLIISASNTWGMLWVILFLGYGLVEVPRDIWRKSENRKSLLRAYFSLPKLNFERLEEEEELEHLMEKGKHWSNQMSSGHRYRSYMDIILDKIEEAEGEIIQSGDNGNRRKLIKSFSSGDLRSNASDNIDENVKLKSLEDLHKGIKVKLHRYLRANALWEDMVARALWMEDVEANKQTGIRYFRKSGFILTSDSSFSWLMSSFEWHWKCKIRSLVLKILAISATLFSALVVWSECTFWVQFPVLSVFARLLQFAALFHNYFIIAIICFTSIGYLSFCVYFTVFRLRIFNYFRLVPNHHSDENSLIFCGMLLCRLTPPLCLNFLGLVHLDSHILVNTSIIKMSSPIVETAYTKFMGHLDLIPLIASGFNLYFPLLVLLLCLFTLLRIGDRLMQFLGLALLFGSYNDGVENYQNSVDEGRILLKRERQNFEKHSRFLNSTDSRVDYKSTVIEMSTKDNQERYHGDNSEFVADTQNLKLLDEYSDDWAPMEYSEEFIKKDYRLVSSHSPSISKPLTQNHLSNNNNHLKTFIKKLWPL